jgi:NAD(P)-dependent dehydrogenase (short-subunit alcohol dehydrogenase family)
MSRDMFDLTGRVALVTGAASGMGRASALALAEFGADLLVADINAAGLESTAEDIRRLGRRALPVVCNMDEIDQIRAMYQTLDREFGRIDILVNVIGNGYLCEPEDLPLDKLQATVQSLIMGRFCSCQEAGRRMLVRGKGSIINMGSLSSTTALGRGNFPYSICMGANAQMTRELSTAWAGRGVRINTLMPAQMVNSSLRERIAADPALEGTFLRGIPMGRLGSADDIRGLIVFLASDASAYVTGDLIPVDGGNLAMNAGGSYPRATKKT